MHTDHIHQSKTDHSDQPERTGTKDDLSIVIVIDLLILIRLYQYTWQQWNLLVGSHVLLISSNQEKIKSIKIVKIYHIIVSDFLENSLHLRFAFQSGFRGKKMCFNPIICIIGVSTSDYQPNQGNSNLPVCSSSNNASPSRTRCRTGSQRTCCTWTLRKIMFTVPEHQEKYYLRYLNIKIIHW